MKKVLKVLIVAMTLQLPCVVFAQEELTENNTESAVAVVKDAKQKQYVFDNILLYQWIQNNAKGQQYVDSSKKTGVAVDKKTGAVVQVRHDNNVGSFFITLTRGSRKISFQSDGLNQDYSYFMIESIDGWPVKLTKLFMLKK